MLVSAPISALHKRQGLALIIFGLSDPIPRIARRADPFLCKGSWYGRLAGTGHADSPGSAPGSRVRAFLWFGAGEPRARAAA